MLKSTKASNEMDGLADVSNQQNSEPQPQPQTQISHLALDIGGSLIKLVYFLRNNDDCKDDDEQRSQNNGDNSQHVLQGRLHFAKFETSKIKTAWSLFILRNFTLVATGGGAFKFADLEKLGISLDKEDEMDCFVAGANFFLKVDGDGKFERVNGTNLGGIFGFGKAFDKGKNFDELLELSHLGNNKVLDMLVGDVYGGTGYSKMGLSATTIASSFGKAISDNKKLEDCKPEDIARSLLRMISNNIDQISYLNALRFGLKQIFLLDFSFSVMPILGHFLLLFISGPKAGLKQCFCSMKGFSGHWSIHEP